MRTLTLDLPDDVYSFLELRSAIDDKRIKEGMENFLTVIARAKKEDMKISLDNSGEYVIRDETEY